MSHTLELAVAYNDLRIVNMFVNNKCDVNAKSEKLGRSLLHVATRNNNRQIARLLLDRGADIDDVSGDGLTALHIAVANRSKSMVELLLARGASVHPPRKFNGKTPLYMAVEYDCPEIADLLMQNGASIVESTITNTTILHVALRIGAANIARLILEYTTGEQLDLKDNLEGKAPLHLAIEQSLYDVVELLLSKGANVEELYVTREESVTPLSLAIRRGDDKMAGLLLRNGARGGVTGCLHLAVTRRRRGIATLLLETKAAPVDERNEAGLTALQIAVINGYRDMVELCLKHGASVTIPTVDKLPILYRAVKDGDYDMVEMLINKGAPVNEFIEPGISILDVAIKTRSIGITKLLLKRGATITQIFALKYVALLAVEGYEMSIENRKIVAYNPTWNRFFDKCLRELDNLKRTKIVGHITFYNLLTKDDNTLAAYARNEDFVNVFPKTEYRKKFITYADNLTLNFTKGRVRNILLQRAVVDFEKLPGFGLPGVCARNVLELLSNQDLRNFIRGVCDCKIGTQHKCLMQLQLIDFL